jgi:predicted alpha/beta-hydrolase family hydrolase
MASGKSTVEISKTIGKVTIKVVDVAKPKAVLTLAHGAGAGMEHPFMESLANGLAKESIATVRFNFPYMENKKGRPDPGPVAEKTVEVVIAKAHQLFPKAPLFTSGKSFGGRMTSQLMSRMSPDYVNGIIFYGFPLHAPGAPAMTRGDHLSSVKVPMLFLQGTRDALADLKLLEKVLKKLPKATLTKFEGADHSFRVSKKQLMDELVQATSSWIDSQIK